MLDHDWHENVNNNLNACVHAHMSTSYIILLSQSSVYNYLVFIYATDSVWKSFKAIGLMVCLVGMTKNCELVLL